MDQVLGQPGADLLGPVDHCGSFVFDPEKDERLPGAAFSRPPAPTWCVPG